MAAERGVYLVRFNVPGSLTVDVDGNQVPMDQFVQRYNPIQVTSLTHVTHGGQELTVAALLIAEEKPEAGPLTW
jgi:hypothetical protein